MKSALKVGYLVQQFAPEVGAGPARVLEMARRWRALGAEVTVITGMPNRPSGRIHPSYRGRLFLEEDWGGLRVLRSWLYASPHPGFARTLMNNTTFMVTSALHALRRLGPIDVLIASSPPFFPHISGAVIHRFTGVPLVLEIRDLWPDYLVGMGVVRSRLGQRALFGLERALLARAARVVVVTESFRRRVVEKGVPEPLVVTISNGVDTGAYYPATEPPPVPELTRRGGECLVGYLGNFGASQALGTILDAALILEREGAPCRMVLAGDGPERAGLLARAERIGLRTASILPPIAKEATRAFYNSCDICLVPLAPFPILQETVPSKLFEIMACGRPVVASLAGEGARLVEESGAGWVAPPGEAEAIAALVRRMAGLTPERRAEFGRCGRCFVAAHFEREGLAERYLELLRSVADSRGRPSGTSVA